MPRGRRASDPDAVRRQVSHCSRCMAMGRDHPVRLASGPEVRQRCDWYVRECADSGCVPNMENLALALGHTAGELRRCPNRDLRATMQLVAGAVTGLSLEGEVQSVPSIFLEKNWFGYADGDGSRDRPALGADRAEIGRRYGLDGADEPGDGEGQEG